MLVSVLPFQYAIGQTNNDTIRKMEHLFPTVQSDCSNASYEISESSKNFWEGIAELKGLTVDQLLKGDSQDKCDEGMAWLKIECDIYYNQSNMCKENMVILRTYLGAMDFDDKNVQYFHDKYTKRLASQVLENNPTETIPDKNITSMN